MNKKPKTEDKGVSVDDKRKRFTTVASRRVQQVLDSMDNLMKCGNKRNYSYTDDEVKKMFKVISDKLVQLKGAYSTGALGGNSKFKF
ncbi:MAG: hypothetical protein EOO01_41550 [Chitinophagaceae bacterium]|nr:MAG: hypothetical protein EOO01_41550 [Chitinophagaceae bacterium]